ncbi:alpha-amylase family glycosyl hydrolase [uncultured Clostridium sp.]|uniref:alpha-amylase family glycosyl hydrolase n=1 Tax=uncultured Clostridium sp. TaxID=59620 RepID=UPI00258DF3BC|nr:alpha-amylase family glycosyl hydrolase [uncultured Clostridium sp.]
MRVNNFLKHKSKLALFTVLMFILTLIPIPNSIAKANAETMEKVKIRFVKEDTDYSNWSIWTWWTGNDGKEVKFTHQDEQGVYAVIEAPKDSKIGFIIKKGSWETKATGNVEYNLSEGPREIIVTSEKIDKDNPKAKIDYADLYKDFDKINVKVNYNRSDKKYDGWQLWNWIVDGQEGSEDTVVNLSETNDYGSYGNLIFNNISKNNKKIGVIIRKSDWTKDDTEKFIDLAYLDCNGNLEVYYKEFDKTTYYSKPEIINDDIVADELVNQNGGKNTWYIPGLLSNWNNSSNELKMKHLVDGFFEYSIVLPKGDHEFKIVKNGTWDGFSDNGGNFKLNLKEKTKVNIYVNEKLNEARINVAGVNGLSQYIPELSNDKWPRLVGDIQEVFGEGKWDPGKSKQMFVDYNFDGSVYKLQRNIPIGKFEAKVAFGANWDESYGSDDNGSNLIINTLDPSDVVFTINYKGDKKLTHNYKSKEGNYDGLIDKSKIVFDSRSITYKKPFGAIKEQTEDLTLRIGVARDDVQVAKVEVTDGNGIAKSYDMRKATTIGDKDYYEVTIFKKEFVGIGVWGYKFILVDGKTKIEYGDDSLSGGTGVAVEEGALPYNLTVYDKNYKTPDWMKNSTVYQIFPDRFFDSNKENNRAKLIDGYRGYVMEDGKLVPYDLQYYDGGVKNDPASSKVWGSWEDYPENPRQSTPENKPYYPNAKTDNIWTNEFYGGDIQGIQEKLNYLKDIGITAIYLNPVAWASSNHKYDATDYKHLDPMFGDPVYNKAGDPTSGLNYEKTRAKSDRIYQAFADAANKVNIKLIADGVFNHVGDDSIYFDRYEKYPEIGAYEYWKRVFDKVNDGKSQEVAEKEVIKEYESKINPLTNKKYSYPEDFKFTTWFKVENKWVVKDKDGNSLEKKDQHYQYEGWWGYDSLPVMESKEPQEGDELALDGYHEWNNVDYRENVIGYNLSGLSEKEAQEKMEFAASQRWIWMGARGWRLDVAPDVSTGTWQKFREAVKSTAGRTDANGNIIDDPVILGEEWGVATNYLLGDQFDSVMNYQFRAALQNYIINGDAVTFNNALEVIRENYPKEAWQAMLNLVDSHDTVRNITKIDNPTWEEENTKIAPEASDKALKLQELTAIFQLGYSGAPTIYYGDEVGVTGTKDPDSRRTFPWERIKENNGEYSALGRYESLFNVYKSAAKVRNENLDVFATGDIYTAYAEGNTIAYARKSESKGGLLVINKETVEKTIEAKVAGFLPDGLELKDQLYGKIKAKVQDGKIIITVPAETGLMMVSTNNIIKVNKVEGLKAKAEEGKVNLSWKEVSEAKEYKIYRTNLEGQNIELIDTVDKASYEDINVENGVRYYYYVTALKDGGESELSEAVTALPSYTIKEVSKPSLVKDMIIGVGNKTEEITIKVNIPGVTNNNEYTGKEVPNFEAKLMYYKAGTLKDNAYSTKLRYKEDSKEDGTKVYFADFEPTEEGIYKYYAKATTNFGDTYVESVECEFNAFKNEDDSLAIEAPILKDILVESNRSKLEWSSNGENVEGYEVYRKEENGEYVKVAVLDKSSREYIDFTVSNGKKYTYKVSAYNKFYNRAYSDERDVTPTLVMVDVTLRLHIPSYTPVTNDIYIAGDFNGWNASGGKLNVPSGATSRDVVEYKFKMMAGKSIQYKYTRGSWDTEAYTSHKRIANDTEDYGNWAYSSTDTNMKLTIQNQGGNSMIIEDYVLGWVDMPMIITMPRISYGENIEYETTEENFTLKAKVPYGVEFTINGEDINNLYENSMDAYGNVYMEGIKLNPGLNEYKIHIEPTEETINLPWYTDDGRASQATRDILMKINYKADDSSEDIKVTGISLNKTSANLKINEELKLVASILPENATNKAVSWTSSDEKVAIVDNDGKVKALSEGKTIITVTTKDGEFVANCEVIVSDKDSNGGNGENPGENPGEKPGEKPGENPDNEFEVIIEKLENLNGQNLIILDKESNNLKVEIKDIEAIKNGNGYIEIRNGENNIVLPFSLIDKDLLKEGATLIFEMKITPDKIITAGIKGVKKVFEFNLFIKNDNGSIPIHNFKDGYATIKLKLSDEELKGLNKDKLAVFYYNEVNGDFEIMETTINGNEITFKTNHFSKFIIAEKTTNEEGQILPQTGANNPTYILILAIIVVGIGSVLLLKNKKSKENNNIEN